MTVSFSLSKMDQLVAISLEELGKQSSKDSIKQQTSLKKRKFLGNKQNKRKKNPEKVVLVPLEKNVKQIVLISSETRELIKKIEELVNKIFLGAALINQLSLYKNEVHPIYLSYKDHIKQSRNKKSISNQFLETTIETLQKIEDILRVNSEENDESDIDID